MPDPTEAGSSRSAKPGGFVPRRLDEPVEADPGLVDQALSLIAESGCSLPEAADSCGVDIEDLEQALLARADAAQSPHQTRTDPERDRRALDRVHNERFETGETPGFAEPLEPGALRKGGDATDVLSSFAPLRWLLGTELRRIAVGALFCVVIVAGVTYLATRGPSTDDSVPSVRDPGPSKPAQVGLPDREDARRAAEAAQAFLAAGNWREQLPMVRMPERAESRMSHWYRSGERSDGPIEHGAFTRTAGTMIHGIPFVVLETTDRATGLPVVVAVDVSGDEPKIDWESHVHHQAMPWAEFKALRPVAPAWFRVRVEPSDDYPEAYDEQRFLSLRLTSPDGVVGLNAYAERESVIGVQIANFVDFGLKERYNLLLELAFDPESSSKSDVLVSGVIEGWVEP